MIKGVPHLILKGIFKEGDKLICGEFVKNINDYVEDELDTELAEKMRLHIEECEECREIYIKKSSIRKQFKITFDIKGMELESQRKAVIEAIDKDKYKMGFLNRIKYHIRRRWGSYVSMAVILSFAVVLVPPAIEKSKKSYSMSDIQKQISVPAKDVDSTIAGGAAVEMSNTKTGALKIESDPEKLKSEIEDLKKMSPGVGPWRVIYSDSENTAFYNYTHLMLFRSTNKFNGIYSAINIRELGLGSMQGSSVISINPSLNGQFYLIGRAGVPNDPGSKNIYLVDMFNKQSKLIDEKHMSEVVFAWSNSSKYFVIADRSGNKISIFDLVSGGNENVSLNKGRLEQISISDEGTVFAAGNSSGTVDKGYIMKKGSYTQNIEIKLTGEFLGFRENGFITSDKGEIYEQKVGYTNKIQTIGQDFKLVQKSLNKRPFNTVFTDGNKLRVYDFETNRMYDFNYKPKDQEYLSFAPGYNFAITDYANIVDRTGIKKTDFPDLSIVFDSVLLNNVLVYVSYTDKPSLGAFTIIKYNVDNRDKTVLFDSTKIN